MDNNNSNGADSDPESDSSGDHGIQGQLDVVPFGEANEQQLPIGNRDNQANDNLEDSLDEMDEEGIDGGEEERPGVIEPELLQALEDLPLRHENVLHYDSDAQGDDLPNENEVNDPDWVPQADEDSSDSDEELEIFNLPPADIGEYFPGFELNDIANRQGFLKLYRGL